MTEMPAFRSADDWVLEEPGVGKYPRYRLDAPNGYAVYWWDWDPGAYLVHIYNRNDNRLDRAQFFLEQASRDWAQRKLRKL